MMKLDSYIEQHGRPQDELLYQLYRETHLTMMHPRMLSGAVQGAFLEWIAAAFAPKKVLEVGTFTGYSAICLARGMAADGQLISIEKDEELQEIAQRYFAMAGLQSRITQLIGDAAELIPQLDKGFDMVFLDADKRQYPLYLELLLPKIKRGGLLIADNVLWGGKVVEPVKANDKDTAGVLAFNRMVQAHPELDNVLLPLRDGLMMVRKL